MRSATLPWLMKRLVPSMTYASPPGSRRAVVRAAAASEPASASVRAKAMSCSPLARGGNQRACCSAVPARVIGSEPSSWTARMSPVVAHARLSCSTARQTDSSSPPRPPCSFRERQGQDVVVGQQAAQVLGELAAPVDLGGPGRDALVGQDADGVAEHLVLLGRGGRGRGRRPRWSPRPSYRGRLARSAPRGVGLVGGRAAGSWPQPPGRSDGSGHADTRPHRGRGHRDRRRPRDVAPRSPQGPGGGGRESIRGQHGGHEALPELRIRQPRDRIRPAGRAVRSCPAEAAGPPLAS